MNSYSFEVAHKYEIWKGYVSAESKEEAEQKILNEEWDDINDKYDVNTFIEGYKILGIWR